MVENAFGRIYKVRMSKFVLVYSSTIISETIVHL